MVESRAAIILPVLDGTANPETETAEVVPMIHPSPCEDFVHPEGRIPSSNPSFTKTTSGKLKPKKKNQPVPCAQNVKVSIAVMH